MVNLPTKTEQMIDALAQQRGISKEGLVNSLLLLALIDQSFVERAVRLNDYMGNRGQVGLNHLNL